MYSAGEIDQRPPSRFETLSIAYFRALASGALSFWIVVTAIGVAGAPLTSIWDLLLFPLFLLWAAPVIFFTAAVAAIPVLAFAFVVTAIGSRSRAIFLAIGMLAGALAIIAFDMTSGLALIQEQDFGIPHFMVLIAAASGAVGAYAAWRYLDRHNAV